MTKQDVSKKQLQSLVQKFYNQTVKSKEYQTMVAQYTEIQQTTGVSDAGSLEKIFDYLDTTLQAKIREHLNKPKKVKNANNNTEV